MIVLISLLLDNGWRMISIHNDCNGIAIMTMYILVLLEIRILCMMIFVVFLCRLLVRG